MLLLLPISAFLLLLAVCFRDPGEFRESFLRAALLWGGWVAIATEALSFFRALNAPGIAAAWALLDALALVWLFRRGGSVPPVWTILRTGWAKWAESRTRIEGVLAAGCAVVVAGVGLIAVVSPPNTPDAMLYHVVRVFYWLQNHSVGLYPTIYPPQLFMPPWSEFAMAHLFALAGSDRFVNLIQWFSFLGCGIGASLVARTLGAGGFGQLLACTAALSIPQGLLQASGAKNDVVLAFWLVCGAHFLFTFARRPGPSSAAAIAASAGLAVMTKSTAYLFLPPIALAAWFLWPRTARIAFLRQLPLMAILIAVLAGPHALRMLSYSGSPLGSATSDEAGVWRFANARFSVRNTASNLVRNTALHLTTPNRIANRLIQRSSERLLAALGVEPNDPATTWPETRFEVPPFRIDEDFTGNLFHLFLIAASAAALAFLRRSRTPGALALAAALACGYLLFCAYLRWQPWHMRLHLPLFVLWSAVIGAVLARFENRCIASLCGIALLALASLALVHNERRPLLATRNIFNSTRAELQSTPPGHYPAAKLADGIGCRNIGIDASFGFLEYPLLSLLRKQDDGRRIEQLSIPNRSAKYRNAAFRPDCVICVDCDMGSARWDRYVAAGMSGAVLDELAFFYPKGTLLSPEVSRLIPAPRPRLKGDSGGWITSTGIDILTPGSLLQSPAALEATGNTILSEHLGPNVGISAELRIAGQPPKRLKAALELPSQPDGTATYRFRIEVDSHDAPPELEVPIHVWFDRYFVPQQIGLNPDTRQLVIMSPRQIRIVR